MDQKNASSEFSIRCLPEDVTFPVQKSMLVEGSEVFANMFACCDADNEGRASRCIDVYESSNDMTILIRLLHEPPPEIPGTKAREPHTKQSSRAPSPVIPYLLLPRLFALADKYSLKPPIMQVLESHLAAQVSVTPLLVYGLAIRYSFPEVADNAGKLLAFTPLEVYSVEDVKIIPSTEAYHKLLQLQILRKQKMKELIIKEELFPHGYGACSNHKVHAEEMWNRRRRRILSELNCGTNVATIMSQRLNSTVKACKVCKKAWVAATEMLDYKCKKVIRRISQMDKEGY